MNGHQPNDFYGEAPPQRSPRQRFHTQPPLHHQGSRGFDNFAPQPDPMFDDFAPPFDAARYNNNRLSSPFANNMNSIESGMPPQPQAWNPPNFGHNNQMAALGATGSRMRPQARTGRHLPNVRCIMPCSPLIHHWLIVSLPELDGASTASTS